MLFDDTYFTIQSASEGLFADRGSRFLAYAYPVTSDGDIKSILAILKKEHPKANHYCWAMRWSTDRSVFRLHDDGEPAGTAGRPILNALLSRNLTNTAVVVVRYFGGRLLGVPGLIHAYRAATDSALDAAGITEKTVNDVYTIAFDYLQMNEVMRLIKDEALEILEQQFDNTCSVKISIRKMLVEQVISKLQKLPSTKIKYRYSI